MSVYRMLEKSVHFMIEIGMEAELKLWENNRKQSENIYFKNILNIVPLYISFGSIMLCLSVSNCQTWFSNPMYCLRNMIMVQSYKIWIHNSWALQVRETSFTLNLVVKWLFHISTNLSKGNRLPRVFGTHFFFLLSLFCNRIKHMPAQEIIGTSGINSGTICCL